MIRYRGYTIEYDPPPIGIRSCDWQFSADGYDGAPDSGDIRCGSAPSEQAAKNQIDDIIEELASKSYSRIDEIKNESV